MKKEWLLVVGGFATGVGLMSLAIGSYIFGILNTMLGLANLYFGFKSSK